MDNPHYREPILYPAAWTAATIGGVAGITRALGSEQVRILWELAERTRERPLDGSPWPEFSHPIIDRLMQDVRGELVGGKGAVLLRGIDLDGRSVEEFGRLFWGLGSHIGHAAMNNARGERLCRVEHASDARQVGVGYLRDNDLRPHSDYHEVLALAAFQRAETGGETGLVSSLEMHNIFRTERADYLRALYEGCDHLAPDGEQVLPRAPLFCNAGGHVSFSFHRHLCLEAAKKLGQPFPAELMRAIDFVEEVAARPELRLRFVLEPGDILFWHNFTVLHSRTAFTDSVARRRLLLRLWLHLDDGRPMHPSFHERARGLDRKNELASRPELVQS